MEKSTAETARMRYTMPSADIILEPIGNDTNGGYQFKIQCSDINTLEAIRPEIKLQLLRHNHNIIDHNGRL